MLQVDPVTINCDLVSVIFLLIVAGLVHFGRLAMYTCNSY